MFVQPSGLCSAKTSRHRGAGVVIPIRWRWNATSGPDLDCACGSRPGGKGVPWPYTTTTSSSSTGSSISCERNLPTRALLTDTSSVRCPPGRGSCISRTLRSRSAFGWSRSRASPANNEEAPGCRRATAFRARDGTGLRPLPETMSEVEKHGLVVALHDDVEAIGSGSPFRRGVIRGLRDQGLTAFRLLDGEEHGIGFVARIAGEINSRIKLFQKAAGEQRHRDMRGLQRVAASGDRPGPDRRKAKPSFGIGRYPPEAAEIRVEGPVVAGIFRVGVTAGGVCLPQFEAGVGDRGAGAVDDPAFDDQALALRARGGKIGPVGPVEPDVKKRPDRLRWRRDGLAGHVRRSPSASPRDRVTRCQSDNRAPIPPR